MRFRHSTVTWDSAANWSQNPEYFGVPVERNISSRPCEPIRAFCKSASLESRVRQSVDIVSISLPLKKLGSQNNSAHISCHCQEILGGNRLRKVGGAIEHVLPVHQDGRSARLAGIALGGVTDCASPHGGAQPDPQVPARTRYRFRHGTGQPAQANAGPRMQDHSTRRSQLSWSLAYNTRERRLRPSSFS